MWRNVLITNFKPSSPVVDVQLGSPSGFNFYLPVDSEPGTEVVITGRVAPGRAGELTCFLHFLFTISKDLLENITCSRRPLDQCPLLGDSHAFPHPLGKPWLCSLSYQHQFVSFSTLLSLSYKIALQVPPSSSRSMQCQAHLHSQYYYHTVYDLGYYDKHRVAKI